MQGGCQSFEFALPMFSSTETVKSQGQVVQSLGRVQISMASWHPGWLEDLAVIKEDQEKVTFLVCFL